MGTLANTHVNPSHCLHDKRGGIKQPRKSLLVVLCTRILPLTLLSLNFICLTWYLRMRTEMIVLKGRERMRTARPTKAE